MAWIAANQLGRRNIPDDTRHYLIGVQYREEKAAQGGTGANQHTAAQSDQNEHSADSADGDDDAASDETDDSDDRVPLSSVYREPSRSKPKKKAGKKKSTKTAEKIAKQHGVGQATVRRAETYADAADELGKLAGAKIKNLVLAGELGPKGDVQKLLDLPEDQRDRAIGKIRSGAAKTGASGKTSRRERQRLHLSADATEKMAPTFGPSTPGAPQVAERTFYMRCNAARSAITASRLYPLVFKCRDAFLLLLEQRHHRFYYAHAHRSGSSKLDWPPRVLFQTPAIVSHFLNQIINFHRLDLRRCPTTKAKTTPRQGKSPPQQAEPTAENLNWITQQKPISLRRNAADALAPAKLPDY